MIILLSTEFGEADTQEFDANRIETRQVPQAILVALLTHVHVIAKLVHRTLRHTLAFITGVATGDTVLIGATPAGLIVQLGIAVGQTALGRTSRGM